MGKTGWFLILIVLLGVIFWTVFLKETDENNQLNSMLKEDQKSVRQPTAAGQFYPTNKEELIQAIGLFLEKAELTQSFNSAQDEEIRGLILPHAGYIFSGWVTAYGFKAIQGQEIKRVVLIGPSHHHFLSEAVIDGHESWQTPLGQVDLDTQLRETLIKESSLFKIDSQPHQSEHWLEVMIPFLQVVLKNFQMLPILVNQLTDENLIDLSRSLSKYLDEQTLIIASSDMSHYPSYEQANYADKKVIEAVLTGQINELREAISRLTKENISNLDTYLCGQKAV
jgi:AmmeMemoRadiSam system protein B